LGTSPPGRHLGTVDDRPHIFIPSRSTPRGGERKERSTQKQATTSHPGSPSAAACREAAHAFLLPSRGRCARQPQSLTKRVGGGPPRIHGYPVSKGEMAVRAAFREGSWTVHGASEAVSPGIGNTATHRTARGYTRRIHEEDTRRGYMTRVLTRGLVDLAL